MRHCEGFPYANQRVNRAEMCCRNSPPWSGAGRFRARACVLSLVKERTEAQRQAIISSVASEIIALSTSAMQEVGRFTFPQQGYVSIAQ
jgi:hypothetical protein